MVDAHSEARRLGEVIRRARVFAKRSQAEVAAALGYHQSKVSRLENGRGTEDTRLLREVARVLGIPLDSLGLTASPDAMTADLETEDMYRRTFLTASISALATPSAPASAAGLPNAHDQLVRALLPVPAVVPPTGSTAAASGRPPNLAELSSRVKAIRRLFCTCSYTELERALPALIADLRRLADGGEERGPWAGRASHGTRGTHGPQGPYDMRGSYDAHGPYEAHDAYGAHGSYNAHGSYDAHGSDSARGPYGTHGTYGGTGAGTGPGMGPGATHGDSAYGDASAYRHAAPPGAAGGPSGNGHAPPDRGAASPGAGHRPPGPGHASPAHIGTAPGAGGLTLPGGDHALNVGTPESSVPTTLSGLLATAYQTAASLLLKQSDHGSAWLAVGRAMAEAERCGDPIVLASSVRVHAHVLLRENHTTQALAIVRNTADQLAGSYDQRSPNYLAAIGLLLLRGVTAASKSGDRDATRELLAEAQDVARYVALDRPDAWANFSPTNVALHEVSAAVSLGDAGVALEAARPLMRRHIPVPERRAALWVDAARAYSQQGRLADGYRALCIAERCAAQDISRPAVRELVADMAARDRHRRLPELHHFSRRLGSAT